MGSGWKGRQDLRAIVDQQGLTSLRRLLSQRTRWSQGNLQAIGLAAEVRRAPFPTPARVELLAYLLMPVWQGVIGLGLIAAIILALNGTASLWGGGADLAAWLLLFARLRWDDPRLRGRALA